MKTSLRNLILAVVIALVISLVAWIEIVLHRFSVPEPQWQTLGNGLMHGFSNPDLRGVSFLSLSIGVGVTFGLLAMWADASHLVPDGRLHAVSGAGSYTTWWDTISFCGHSGRNTFSNHPKWSRRKGSQWIDAVRSREPA